MDRKEFLKTLGLGMASISAFSQIFSGSEELPKLEEEYPETEGIVTKEFVEIDLSGFFRHGDNVRYMGKNGEYQYAVVISKNGKEGLMPLDPDQKGLVNPKKSLHYLSEDLEHLSSLLSTDQINIKRDLFENNKPVLNNGS